MLIPRWPVQSLSQEDPGEGNGTPVQYPCLKNSMDKRSLVGYSPWGCKRVWLDEQLNMFIDNNFNKTNCHMESSVSGKRDFSIKHILWACSGMFDPLWPDGLEPASLLLSVELFRQEYWSGLPFPSPGDLLEPGVKCTPPVSPVLGGGFFTTEPLGKPNLHLNLHAKILTSEKWNRFSICPGEEDNSGEEGDNSGEGN